MMVRETFVPKQFIYRILEEGGCHAHLGMQGQGLLLKRKLPSFTKGNGNTSVSPLARELINKLTMHNLL
jgi:hypothetical protein